MVVLWHYDKAILIHNKHGYSVSGMFTLEYRKQTCLDHAHYSAHIKLIHFTDMNVSALELVNISATV
jgi:hypothetical protein